MVWGQRDREGTEVQISAVLGRGAGFVCIASEIKWSAKLRLACQCDAHVFTCCRGWNIRHAMNISSDS